MTAAALAAGRCCWPAVLLLAWLASKKAPDFIHTHRNRVLAACLFVAVVLLLSYMYRYMYSRSSL